MRLKFFVLFILLVSIKCSLFSIPMLKDSEIHFKNKSVLKFQKIEKILQKSIIEVDKPVKYLEIPEIISEWERVVIVRIDKYFEGSTTSLKVFDFNGKLLMETEKYGVQEVYYLLKNEKIVLAGSDYPGIENYCYFFDRNGQLENQIKVTGDIMKLGLMNEPEFVYIIYNSGMKKIHKNQIPDGSKVNDFDELVLNTLLVIDSLANQIVKYEFDRKQSYQFNYKRKSYLIELPIPNEL